MPSSPTRTSPDQRRSGWRDCAPPPWRTTPTRCWCWVATRTSYRSSRGCSPTTRCENGHRDVSCSRCPSGPAGAGTRPVHCLRDRLADELGIDPSPDLQRLHQQILRQDPDLDAATDPGGPSVVGQRSTDPPLPGHGSPAGRSPDDRPGTLPPGPVRLVGRDPDLAAVVSAARPGELVTLTGAGGVGKTSLAVRSAHELRSRYPDGAWFCDLSVLTAADDLPLAVTTALDLRASGEAGPTAQLLGYLRTQVPAAGPRQLRARARCSGERRAPGPPALSQRDRAGHQPCRARRPGRAGAGGAAARRPALGGALLRPREASRQGPRARRERERRPGDLPTAGRAAPGHRARGRADGGDDTRRPRRATVVEVPHPARRGAHRRSAAPHAPGTRRLVLRPAGRAAAGGVRAAVAVHRLLRPGRRHPAGPRGARARGPGRRRGRRRHRARPGGPLDARSGLRDPQRPVLLRDAGDLRAYGRRGSRNACTPRGLATHTRSWSSTSRMPTRPSCTDPGTSRRPLGSAAVSTSCGPRTPGRSRTTSRSPCGWSGRWRSMSSTGCLSRCRSGPSAPSRPPKLPPDRPPERPPGRPGCPRGSG